jgi:quercetin dioxygenase-like cupin family protein
MQISNIPFSVIDWKNVEAEEHKGETGKAIWRTKNFDDIRVRMVEYSPGYSADHWCSKGHIILCLEGNLNTELSDGRKFVLSPGMSYHVADESDAHRSSTTIGAKLFIVD